MSTWNRFVWDDEATWPRLNRLVYVWAAELEHEHFGWDLDTVEIEVAALMEDDACWWTSRGEPFDCDGWNLLAHPAIRGDRRPVDIRWHELPALPDGSR